ncbi:hypothetical protein E2C01_015951 [Portunus trituberculatus]|uniref:Uncharacterized protein n=1 Tax=Portunus trituberculatus TaxID=210409 RepID=A0A5B7DMT4_PORTR|nr:hypothetical protein [Portunus trituberculatus]
MMQSPFSPCQPLPPSSPPSNPDLTHPSDKMCFVIPVWEPRILPKNKVVRQVCCGRSVCESMYQRCEERSRGSKGMMLHKLMWGLE